jgi:hypothetical protein
LLKGASVPARRLVKGGTRLAAIREAVARVATREGRRAAA